MLRFSREQRRHRLARRHHVAPSTRHDDVVTVAGDLIGLHGSDPASVFVSGMARVNDPRPEVLELALYDERRLLRMLGMRRTMFVVPVDLIPVVHASSTAALVPRERKRLVQHVEEGGIADDGAAWLEEAVASTMAYLEAKGEAMASELTASVPALKGQLHFGIGTKWQGTQAVTTRVLTILAAEGRVARGRPRGTWTSSQHRWSPMSAWLPGGVGHLDRADAQATLVRRWLHAFGPAPLGDLVWWTGWTKADTRRALVAVGAVEVVLEDEPGLGLVLADDLEPEPAVEPWAALLPSLDPTVMGWAARGWYLGEHRGPLFDRNGNAGPTVWWDGRIVGGWALRPKGERDAEVRVRVLEDVGVDATTAIEREVERLSAWLGPVRFTPRFPTPLERSLRT